MSVFRRLSNLAKGKVLEWQKSLDDTDAEELVERARDAARRASERLERAMTSPDDPAPTFDEEPASSPVAEPAPSEPAPAESAEPTSGPRKRRL